MHIVLVTQRYWPARGGVQTHVRLLAHQLVRSARVTILAQRIDEVPATRLSDSLTPPPRFEPFDDDGVQVRQIRLGRPARAALLPLAVQVVPYLRRYSHGRLRLATAALYARVAGPAIARLVPDADIVHCFGGNHLAAATVTAARRLRVPVVNMPSAHPGQWDDDPASAAAYRKCDLVIGQLDADAQIYLDLGVAPERVGVAGACVEDAWSEEAGRRLREQKGLDGPLAVFLGARRGYKGEDVVRDTAARLAARRPDVTFAFVGPGPPIPDPEDENVLDAGVVDDGEKRAWLSAADVLCLPSSYESFGVAVVEAWSARTSAVVSDIPVLKELVERSGTGRAVARNPDSVADAVVSLLDDERREERADQARAYWSDHYRPEIVAQWHMNAYERLIGARPSRS